MVSLARAGSSGIELQATYRTTSDGLAFFLAPNGSQVPDDSGGECLGLISTCSSSDTTGLAIVAVEFDTYLNNWDPSDNHVGINVNSIRSVAYITLSKSIKNGSKVNARVTYNSQTRYLSLFLTYDDNPVFNRNDSTLSYKIDLSMVLPEWVTVGLSSSTGGFTEIQTFFHGSSTQLKFHPSETTQLKFHPSKTKLAEEEVGRA
ncbi:hypothetical protein GH714_029248 [Hevea brasiliensis]|uniref:Legume lectin domain-containing protein n=1 Tax=Hevea brasiliensis TaxID=3981 RepID=A0A6A6N7S6_HEVBR|nr:hypothetical protein GH714_029248 [Hevea brasiliensis]